MDIVINILITLGSTLAGLALGGYVTYRVSRHYYNLASRELRDEAAALRRETEDARHYINALISYLEAAGTIRVVRDESGRPIETQIIRLSLVATSTNAASLGVAVQRADKDAPRPKVGPRSWWQRMFGERR